MAGLPMFDVNVVAGCDGGRTVFVVGEVDLATVPELREGLQRALSASSGTHVVVDVTDVEFIDAAGIGALVDAAVDARAAGGELVLRRPSRAVRRVLELLSLGGELPTETLLG